MQHLPKTFSLTVLAAAIGLAAMASASAQSQTGAAHGKAAAAKPPFPALRLNEMSNGEKAITALGANLPAVAAHYGKTAGELMKQLRSDRSAWIDKNGRMLFVEKALTTAVTNLAPANAIYPLEQTMLLHSRPGSKRKIYLDFNGHTTTGTEWNSSYGLSSIVSPAYDLDGVPGSFSADELSRIQNIWRQVAEDYAPFDVDVTTEEPPADQMFRLGWLFNDDTYGIRAVITKDFTTNTAKGSCGCGGFAYRGSFDETTEVRKPTFIFYDKLGYAEKAIAEATSHEVGHTLGLSHDGTSTLGYYYGHGTSSGGWAPIMGVGYNQAVVQFSKGEYPDANNKEDDYLVMQSNGVQFVADDFGNTIAMARTLAGTALNGTSTYDARGLIETPSDVDVFKFYSSPGTVVITAAPFEVSPNLDIRLEVRDVNGVLIAQANPYETLSASTSVYIPAAGNYYVSIQGAGDAVPAIHLSDYGSIGRYAFRVTAPVVAGPPSCAIRIANYRGVDFNMITFSGSGSSDATGPIASYRWDFGDGSPTASGISATHTYYDTGSYVTALTVTNSAGMSSSCSLDHDVEILSTSR